MLIQAGNICFQLANTTRSAIYSKPSHPALGCRAKDFLNGAHAKESQDHEAQEHFLHVPHVLDVHHHVAHACCQKTKEKEGKQ